MSAPCTVISFWPSSCQKLWKLVEIWQSYAKTILTVFRHGVWHLRRSDSTAAVGRPTERGSTARHWSSSTWPHHSSAQTASLAACEAENRLQTGGAGVQVSACLCSAVPVVRLSTRHWGGTSAPQVIGRSHVYRPADTVTDLRQEFYGSGSATIKQPADWDPTERHYFWTL